VSFPDSHVSQPGEIEKGEKKAVGDVASMAFFTFWYFIVKCTFHHILYIYKYYKSSMMQMYTPPDMNHISYIICRIENYSLLGRDIV